MHFVICLVNILNLVMVLVPHSYFLSPAIFVFQSSVYVSDVLTSGALLTWRGCPYQG